MIKHLGSYSNGYSPIYFTLKLYQLAKTGARERRSFLLIKQLNND